MSAQESIDKLKEYYEPTKDDEEYILNDKWERSTEGTMYPLSKGFLIRIGWDDTKFWKSLSIALHELVHMVHYTLRRVRIPLSEDTEEVYTYLIEELFRQLSLEIMK